MSSKAPRTPLKIKFWSTNRKKFKKMFKNVTHANYLNGKKLYENRCASCHGINGSGNQAFPPLWGKNEKGEWLSYTADGSMAKLENAATWIQDNMPFATPRSLTDQETVDITLYVNSNKRADYKEFKVKDNFKKLNLNLDSIIGK